MIMNVYVAYVGFYQEEISNCEIHSNLFVVANNKSEAKAKLKKLPEFLDKKMHLDRLIEVIDIDGHAVQVSEQGE